MNNGQYTQALASLLSQIQASQPNTANATQSQRYGAGNIDLYNRPQYRNPDGSVSTVDSMSFNDNGQEVLIPTVGFGAYGQPVRMTDDQAMQRYYDTGEYLGRFNSIPEADRYAEALHNAQARLYPEGNRGAELQNQYSQILRMAGLIP